MALGQCPRANAPDCPYRSQVGCESNKHHQYWPRRDYKTSLEKEFRELPENKEQICKWLHQLIHENSEPPEKPNVQDMIRAIAQSAIQGGQEHDKAA